MYRETINESNSHDDLTEQEMSTDASSICPKCRSRGVREERQNEDQTYSVWYNHGINCANSEKVLERCYVTRIIALDSTLAANDPKMSRVIQDQKLQRYRWAVQEISDYVNLVKGSLGIDLQHIIDILETYHLLDNEPELASHGHLNCFNEGGEIEIDS